MVRPAKLFAFETRPRARVSFRLPAKVLGEETVTTPAVLASRLNDGVTLRPAAVTAPVTSRLSW